MSEDLRTRLDRYKHPTTKVWWAEDHGKPVQVVKRDDFDGLMKIANRAVDVYSTLADAGKMVRVLGTAHNCGRKNFLQNTIYCTRCNRLAEQIARELKT